jgi:ribonuclease BN (tRNA processing enzyme)
VRNLAQAAYDGVLLIDGPGVVRGVAGRELLAGLVDASGVEVVLALTAAGRLPPLLDELRTWVPDVYVVHAASEAKRPGKRVRARSRTEQWNAYLEAGIEYGIDLTSINLVGTPPPIDEPYCWEGRMLALLQGNRTVVMGEVLQLDGTLLTVIAPGQPESFDTVLIRDAQRTVDGMVETAAPFTRGRFEFIPPPDVLPSVEDNGGPRIVGRVGSVDVALVNGVFGDPLLHLRIRHLGRSFLFDLGEGSRLAARIAHQVTDVFISHAHMDHISGIQWLLRSRLGEFPTCRIYGPPGLARHVEGFIQSFLWDRIGERGPCFEVAELHEDRLHRYRLQAGHPGCKSLGEAEVVDGILLDEPGFRVRGIMLDHKTPVMAYAYEPDKEINIRKDRLQEQGLEPGPWLTELKQQLLAENDSAVIQLPNGQKKPAGRLGTELAMIRPAKRLVYATDLADTPVNRERLIAFARNAHTFFCESPFIKEDVQHAMRNGHLTTSACGEIATAAGVGRLVTFHFSRRYRDNPQQIYEELKESCSRVEIPKSMSIFEASDSAELDPEIKLEPRN